MIRVTVEIIPKGDENAKRVENVIEIENVEIKDSGIGIYRVTDQKGRIRTIRHRREYGIEKLLQEVMEWLP